MYPGAPSRERSGRVRLGPAGPHLVEDLPSPSVWPVRLADAGVERGHLEAPLEGIAGDVETTNDCAGRLRRLMLDEIEAALAANEAPIACSHVQAATILARRLVAMRAGSTRRSSLIGSGEQVRD
jgi:hypothetical protein